MLGQAAGVVERTGRLAEEEEKRVPQRGWVITQCIHPTRPGAMGVQKEHTTGQAGERWKGGNTGWRFHTACAALTRPTTCELFVGAFYLLSPAW